MASISLREHGVQEPPADQLEEATLVAPLASRSPPVASTSPLMLCSCTCNAFGFDKPFFSVNVLRFVSMHTVLRISRSLASIY